MQWITLGLSSRRGGWNAAAGPLANSILQRSHQAMRTFRKCGIVLLLGCLVACNSWAQTFSSGLGGKKKVVLHRKLPAAVKLDNISTFGVAGEAKSKDQADVAQSLTDILITELQKNDKRLQESKNSPQMLISFTITHYEIPPPQTSTRSENVLQKGHMVQVPKQYYRMIGELEVSYQAKDQKSGHTLDSQNLSAKYNREFESGTNQATDKSLGTKFTDPFKKLAGKKVEDEGAPPTPIELRHKLIRDAVTQIAARLVSTDEIVEVLLAHGKQLDAANKLAESGLWSRCLETLETMTPFSDPREDAYRIYNIGVANEALGYQAEDHKTASKFLQEAAISYGKAIDTRPDEKNFLEPQTRIETAVTYYKKLDEQQVATQEKPTTHDADAATPSKAGSTKSATGLAKGNSTESVAVNANVPSSSGSDNTKTANASSATNARGKSTSTASRASAPELTNQKVIDMLKGGVDEENIIATIREARSVQFDLSPDAQIQLAQNGVKGKVLAAMRERARQANRAKTGPQG
jgi:hypothetical protein